MSRGSTPAARRGPLLRVFGALFALFALLLVVILAGCGDDKPDSDTAVKTSGGLFYGGDDSAGLAQYKDLAPVSWTLVLDYEPNAVHAGLLRAVEAGYFKQANIDLKVIAPASTSDALTQVTRGRADLGLGDLIDVARRNERAGEAPAKAQAEGKASAARVALAGAIVQRPLSGLLVDAAGPITKPQQLENKRIAVSGVPSDDAVVAAIVRSGDSPLPVKKITLGFNGLKALKAGRVEATTAYWPADAVTLKQLGKEARVFKLDDNGGPVYPGLVAFATETTQAKYPQQLQAFAAALHQGTADVIAKPEVGLAALAAEYPELDPETTKLQLEQYRPLFGTAKTAGRIDGQALGDFTTFAVGAGLLKSGGAAGDLAPEKQGGAYVQGPQPTTTTPGDPGGATSP